LKKWVTALERRAKIRIGFGSQMIAQRHFIIHLWRRVKSPANFKKQLEKEG